MPSDNEQKDGFLLSIWQAIELVGDVRERSDEIDTSELETVLAEAESLLIVAVSEAVRCPGGPTRQRRGLRFWKPAHDTPSGDVSWSGVTSVIPFPASRLGSLLRPQVGKSTAQKTGKPAEISQPARPPHFNPGGAETGPSSLRTRSGSIGRQVRLLMLVVLAVLPMIAMQAWHERQLRNERQGIIRERVVYRVQQLAADIGELREGARQLLLAIAQLEAVKLRQPEACFALLVKLRSRYPNYSLLAAADVEGRIFCASGPTAASVADQSRRYIRRLVGLAFLSPQLVEAILQGWQPVELTATRLTELDLPLDWAEQHRLLTT